MPMPKPSAFHVMGIGQVPCCPSTTIDRTTMTLSVMTSQHLEIKYAVNRFNGTRTSKISKLNEISTEVRDGNHWK